MKLSYKRKTTEQIRNDIYEIQEYLPYVDLYEEDDYIHVFRVAPPTLDRELHELLERMLNDSKRLAEILDNCYNI